MGRLHQLLQATTGEWSLRSRVGAWALAVSEAVDTSSSGDFIGLPNVTALRNLQGKAGQIVALNGYSNSNGADQGLFQWDTIPGTDNGVTRFNKLGIGSNQAGWKRVFTGPLDLRWGGADGSGLVDESVEVQRVVDAANALGLGIVVPALTFLVTGLVSNAPLSIMGLSRTLSILKQPAHSTEDILTTEFDLAVASITFDGNKANQDLNDPTERNACIRFDGTDASIYVTNTTFQNTTATAIIATVVENDYLVFGCAVLDQADANGVTLSYPNVAVGLLASTGFRGNVVVMGNRLVQTDPTPGPLAPAGIEINGSAPPGPSDASGLSVTISFNYFYGLGNTDPGIGCIDLYDYVGKSTIVGNRIWNRTGGGIKVADAACTTISANSVNGQAWAFNVAGIYYSGAAHILPEVPFPDVAITGNVIKDCPSSYGIHVVGDGTVDGHEVRGVTVAGNTIEACSTGIYVDGCADSSFTGNIVRDSTTVSFSDGGVVFFRCSGDISFADNQILDSANVGLFCYAEQNALRLAVRGNTFRASNGAYQVRALPMLSLELSDNNFQGTSPTILISTGNIPTPSVIANDNTNTPGAVSAVAQSGSVGAPIVTLTGTPKADNAIEIEITAGGALGVGTWRWLKNGVEQEAGLTLTASYELGSTGLTAHFAAGTYVLNDLYDATTAELSGLISVIAQRYVHRGNTWDTLYGNGALTTVTINPGTQTAYNVYPWGADLGDLVTVACDQDLQGLQALGEVTAQNGVKIRLTNQTAGAITLTDARFQCKVEKRVNPTFTPADMATLVKLWLEADAGVTKDGADQVTRWEDGSRNDYYPAVQAVAADGPLYVANVYNGKPTLRGRTTAGLALQAALDLGTAQFVIWAMKASSVAAYEWATIGGAGVISKVSGNLTEWINGADRYTFANNPIGLHIYAITQDDAGGAGSLQMYFDGAALPPQVATVPFPNIINFFSRGIAGGSSDGDIPAYIAGIGIPTEGELKSLTRYLGSEYGVVVP